MSDLEDLDHEPDNLSLDEELSAPADRPASDSAEQSSGSPINKSMLLAVAAALVVVVGGGFFFMKSHQARPFQAGTSIPPAATQNAAMPKDNAQASAGTPWGVPPAAAPQPSDSGIPAADSKPRDILPSAIPPMDQGTGVPASATPQIVNEMPPSSAQLANAGGAAAPSPAEASIPGMPTSIDAVPSAPSPASSAAASPQLPAGFPAGATDINAASPQAQPSAPAAAGNGEAMPSTFVPTVDRTDLGKPGEGAAMPNAAANSAAADTASTVPNNTAAAPVPQADAAAQAKIDSLQKKIADLEKTISQLQQAAVVKEETAEKAPVAAPRHHARVSSRHRQQRHTAHVAAPRWVLKAAKPGVAWVAKKGSDDLRMIETGDSLTGIGQIVAVTQDSFGTWVVRGTKGRISQK